MRIDQTTFRDLDVQPGAAKDKPSAQQTDVAKANETVDLTSLADIERAGGDVRANRIAEVRDRIASGFYNQGTVREQIASAFLNAQQIGRF